MDRDAKLAAARKRLHRFQRKKGQKDGAQNGRSLKSEVMPTHDAATNRDLDSVQMKKTEDYIDETFELLYCNDEGLPQNAEAMAENILQVSAKLNAIAVEADMLSDDGLMVNSDITEDSDKIPEHESLKEAIISLKGRNVKLAESVSKLNQEKQELSENCVNLTNQIQGLQRKLEEVNDLEKNRGFADDAMRQQLQVQMQTIGVLVSEKQDLQQELLVVQSKVQSSNRDQTKVGNELKDVKEKVMSLERDLQAKIDMLTSKESSHIQLQHEYTSCQDDLQKTKQLLDQEQTQSFELRTKLNLRESEYRELYQSHEDAQEKLGMADVLLQQMTASDDSDAFSKLTHSQKEVETLSLQLNNYRQAFEQLTVERDQLTKQYYDAERQWADHLQSSNSKVQTLEEEKLLLSERCDQLQTSLDETDKEGQEKFVLVPPSSESEDCNHDTAMKNALKAQAALHEELVAAQNNNQHLSSLIHEKECHITELEGELDKANSFAKEHEQLADDARNDKATISRALLQNKQLKQQLEEIEAGFVSMSNDKMDLATQVSSLQHTVKDLQTRLEETATSHGHLQKDLEYKSTEVLHLQQQVSHLQNSALPSRVSPRESEDLAAVSHISVLKLKVESYEDQVKHLSRENLQLRSQLESASAIVVSSQTVIPEEELYRGESEVDDFSQSQPLHVADEGSSTGVISVSDEDSTKKDESHPNAMLMLQDKFTAVMNEKVELLNRLELLEHANTQLQNECDTIGEYIALYHNQRQVLRQRHQEKDDYISGIIQEREAMKSKVEQLQTLIVSMLRHNPIAPGCTSPHVDPSDSLDTSQNDGQIGVSVEPKRMQSQPDLVPKADFSPILESEANLKNASVKQSEQSASSAETFSSPHGDDATTAQILSILKQMQAPVESGAYAKSPMPSGFCMHYIGPYTAI